MGTPYRGYDRPILPRLGLLDKDVPCPRRSSLYAQMKANNQPVELHLPRTRTIRERCWPRWDLTPFVARISALTRRGLIPAAGG